MPSVKLTYAVIFLLCLLVGCTQSLIAPIEDARTTSDRTEDAGNVESTDGSESREETIALLTEVPHSAHGFLYTGLQTYPEPWGYSLRYQHHQLSHTHADIYIYPVPESINLQSHKRVILEMATQSLQEIDFATQQGSYSEYQLLRNSSFELEGHFVTRSDLFLVRQNLAVYSMLFLTEKEGRLIKARITVPDNEANRNDPQWQAFVEEIFTAIIENIHLT